MEVKELIETINPPNNELDLLKEIAGTGRPPEGFERAEITPLMHIAYAILRWDSA